jgi:hypothetical protein
MQPRNLAVWGLPVGTSGPVSASPFNHTFVSPEKGHPIFPKIYRGHDGGETSVPFQRGQILPLQSPGEGGNRRHVHHLSLVRRGRHLDTSILHHYFVS